MLRRLRAAIEAERSVSIVGDSLVGKTSLLLSLLESQKTVSQEVRLLSGRNEEGESPQTLVEKITGLSTTGAGADEAADCFERWLQEIQSEKKPPLILIDCFDRMVVQFEFRFFERLRGMLDRIILVVASRQELDLLYENLAITSPFTNRLELQWLGLLEPEAADELVSWGSKLFDQDDVRLIHEWAGRHPFYLQLLGNILFETRANGESLDGALTRFRIESQEPISEVWKNLSERDKDSLRMTLTGQENHRLSLRTRGLTDSGKPFGRVLSEWIHEADLSR